MTTIKDLMQIAFIAGQNAGMGRAQNIINSTNDPVRTFEELINGKFYEYFDLNTEVTIKVNIDYFKFDSSKSESDPTLEKYIL